MAITTISGAIGCTGLPFSSVDADLLVIPWFEQEGPAAVPGIDAASGGEVARALDAKEFVGRSYDIFSRLLYGARASLAVSLVSALLATILGAFIGGLAAYVGGWLDGVLSRVSEFVLVLPAIYVALVLRAVLPLVLPPSTVFAMLIGIFTLLGWPIVARGVRAIVLVEREREYAIAAHAAGASDGRVLLRHLLPASAGFLQTQASLLVPAFMLGEATLSYVGLGFPNTIPTWGTMLQDASNVALLGDAPWSLAPAAAIFVVVLGVNLLAQSHGRAPVQLEP
jgi:peptide/nickel transport system permease protein